MKREKCNMIYSHFRLINDVPWVAIPGMANRPGQGWPLAGSIVEVGSARF
jgi:hypothetical protein